MLNMAKYGQIWPNMRGGGLDTCKKWWHYLWTAPYGLILYNPKCFILFWMVFSSKSHQVYTGWSCIITDIRWPTVAAGAQVGKPSLPTGAGHWVPDLYNSKTGLNNRELTWTREVWLEHKKPDLNKRSIWFEDNEDEQKKKVLWKQLYQACT